jgi:hypothetical protein
LPTDEVAGNLGNSWMLAWATQFLEVPVILVGVDA